MKYNQEYFPQNKSMNLSQKQRNGFLMIEKLTFAYSLITALLVMFLWNRLDNPLQQLLTRFFIVAATCALQYITTRSRHKKLFRFARVVFQFSLLSYWYPDTYEFNKFFPNLDHLFAAAEQLIFGFQPALLFAQKVSAAWLSEAFYMGYFAYYPMIAAVALFCFLVKPADFNRFSVLIIGSFLIYYIIYIFLPVTGPQFYFYAIGIENAQAGNFPSVGNYFRYHRELLPGPGYGNGLFYKLVKMSQTVGERPTAAFPSSHVGISTLLLLWSAKNNKWLALSLLPFYVLLCCATVYIQAHYLIDVFGGWITAALLYFFLYLIPLRKGKLN